MHDVPLNIHVLPPLRADRELPAAAVISLKEAKRITTGHYSSALIVEERGCVAFEDCDVVSEPFESETCCKTSERATNL